MIEVRYYSEDHEGTIEPHDMKHEAEAAAEPETVDNQWPEFASDCEWGVMIKLGQAQQVNTREDPDGNFNYLCEFPMVDVDPTPQIREAFPDIARKLDAMDKFEALFAEYSEHMNKVPWEPIGLEDIDDLIEKAKR